MACRNAEIVLYYAMQAECHFGRYVRILCQTSPSSEVLSRFEIDRRKRSIFIISSELSDPDSPFLLGNTFANHLELTSMHVWMCKARLMHLTSFGSGELDQAEARLFLQQLLERMWEHVTRSLTGILDRGLRPVSLTGLWQALEHLIYA